MNDEGFVIDHVIYGVVDVDAASERLREEHGLGSVAGSPHLGGTNSRIVPLGPECFLELLGIEDASKDDGRWLEATLQGQDRVLWWCLGVTDLDDTAARRGLPLRSGQVREDRPDSLTFRSAGMPQFPLPFFLALVGDPARGTGSRSSATRPPATRTRPPGTRSWRSATTSPCWRAGSDPITACRCATRPEPARASTPAASPRPMGRSSCADPVGRTSAGATLDPR